MHTNWAKYPAEKERLLSGVYVASSEKSESND
jgi:hypothetical protein